MLMQANAFASALNGEPNNPALLLGLFSSATETTGGDRGVEAFHEMLARRGWLDAPAGDA